MRDARQKKNDAITGIAKKKAAKKPETRQKVVKNAATQKTEIAGHPLA